jgi:hypothetical protein
MELTKAIPVKADISRMTISSCTFIFVCGMRDQGRAPRTTGSAKRLARQIGKVNETRLLPANSPDPRSKAVVSENRQPENRSSR